MGYYDGPATLTGPTGAEVPAEVSLRTHTDGALRNWDGTATVEDFDPTTRNDFATLRLPDGREGRVVVTGTPDILAHPITLELTGTGPAPYED